MSSLTKEQLRADLKTSMLAQDKVRTRTLRSLLTAITQAEVSGTEAVELTAEQLLDVVSREAKKRREAIEEFGKAGRDDLVAKEAEEAAVLADYQPQQLTADEIDALVAQVIADTGTAGAGPKAMGQVMGKLTPLTKGRADGKLVAETVRRLLA